MKNRAPHVGRGDGAMASTSREANLNRRVKNRQRLGGHGLSLQAFANAKSNNSYNPHLIEKQREMYKNAKIVKKFKKTFKQVKQQNQMEKSLPSSVPEGTEATGNVHKQNAGAKRKRGSLQSVREEYERKRDEMEKARKEREAAIQAKEEKKARAESQRKVLRQSMFKKTRFGQPVMKYRIEHLLQGIKDEQHS